MDLSDEYLMAKVKAGNYDFLSELFNRHSRRVFNYFLKSTLDRDESADLTQILFIRVMKYRKSYQEERSFVVWIFQIARNLIKDHFKKMKVYKDQFNPIEVVPEIQEDEDHEQMEREERLYAAMNKLPDEKRELLVLSKFEGLKYEQIAELKGTTVSNIKVQVHRTIKELRNLYFEPTLS